MAVNITLTGIQTYVSHLTNYKTIRKGETIRVRNETAALIGELSLPDAAENDVYYWSPAKNNAKIDYDFVNPENNRQTVDVSAVLESRNFVSDGEDEPVTVDANLAPKESPTTTNKTTIATSTVIPAEAAPRTAAVQRRTRV